jgi:hypothetical protein
MVTNIKISSLIILILCIFGCQNAEQKPIKKIEKDFGLYENESDSIAVELKLNEFNNWNKLLERTDKIVCNDSLPKITVTTNNELKTIYFRNPCSENIDCALIKQRNIIEIQNDKITKNYEYFFPLDSLESFLRRDIENNGKNPKLSENPDKLLIYISYNDKNGFKTLPNTLDHLTEAYNQITNKLDIKIFLTELIDFVPPPPPMSEIELNE